MFSSHRIIAVVAGIVALSPSVFGQGILYTDVSSQNLTVNETDSESIYFNLGSTDAANATASSSTPGWFSNTDSYQLLYSSGSWQFIAVTLNYEVVATDSSLSEGPGMSFTLSATPGTSVDAAIDAGAIPFAYVDVTPGTGTYYFAVNDEHGAAGWADVDFSNGGTTATLEGFAVNTSGGDILVGETSAVPEPSNLMWLAGLSVLGLALGRSVQRRRMALA